MQPTFEELADYGIKENLRSLNADRRRSGKHRFWGLALLCLGLVALLYLWI